MAISDFLLPPIEQEEKEVKLERFPVPFVITPISERTDAKLRKAATTVTTNRQGQRSRDFDQQKYIDLVITNCIKVPDLSDSELQGALGTQGSQVETLHALVKAGEYAVLSEEIQKINGFDEDINELKEEAKKE